MHNDQKLFVVFYLTFNYRIAVVQLCYVTGSNFMLKESEHPQPQLRSKSSHYIYLYTVSKILSNGQSAFAYHHTLSININKRPQLMDRRLLGVTCFIMSCCFWKRKKKRCQCFVTSFSFTNVKRSNYSSYVAWTV